MEVMETRMGVIFVSVKGLSSYGSNPKIMEKQTLRTFYKGTTKNKESVNNVIFLLIFSLILAHAVIQERTWKVDFLK